jgi:hypothetical protein
MDPLSTVFDYRVPCVSVLSDMMESGLYDLLRVDMRLLVAI